jgi:SAM-dependent methyltransferase
MTSIEFASVPDCGGYQALMRDRSGFQRAFRQWLLDEPASRGAVLDIGCGAALPPHLADLRQRARQLDGVDMREEVNSNTFLDRRWRGMFEETPIPEKVYDLAYAYNVVEHIVDPPRFLKKVDAVLKPGGVFWALTSHSNHPFCLIARGVELMGGKRKMRENLRLEAGRYTVNDYPAYYRMNRVASIMKAIQGMNFGKVSFHAYPCMQWDTYFPRMLRWAPHTYDYLLGTRFRHFMLIFAFRLEKV